MRTALSDHFTVGRLLRFTMPSIVMMVFMSLYSIVDGFFVSNFAGKTALGAVNLALPYAMMLAVPGFMFGTGGSALVAKTLGEGNAERANRLFTMFVYTTAILGTILLVVGWCTMESYIRFVGGTGDILNQSVRYGRIVLCSLPAFSLQQAFPSLFAAAGRPQTGLFITIGAGVTNMVLDYLFVGVLGWGLEGAAWATVSSEFVGGILPVLYFLRPNPSSLRLVPTRFEPRAVGKGAFNGLSELLSSISMSIVTTLFNMQLLRFVGEDGVSAYSVLMYVNLLFISVFLGYSVGLNPIVGYNFGARDRAELQNVLRKSLLLTAVFAVAMTAAGELLGGSFASLFVGYDSGLLAMTTQAFRICSLMFLFSGFSILGSAFFTGLNNGALSALISVSRTLGFQVLCVLLLPEIMGVPGIWWSVVISDLCAALVTFLLLFANKKRYGY